MEDSTKSISHSTSEPFGGAAERMRALGWAVLPAAGKAPMIKGFPNWRRAPGLKALRKWAGKYAGRNIAIVPGLCVPAPGFKLCAFDCDDHEVADVIRRHIGYTPGIVGTRDGAHHWFKVPGSVDFGTMHSLRAHGLEIDFKHGQGQAGIVVAPPSVHPDDSTFAYSWFDCDESVIRELPTLDGNQLQSLLERYPKVSKIHPERFAQQYHYTAPPRGGPPASSQRNHVHSSYLVDEFQHENHRGKPNLIGRCDSRGLALNDALVRGCGDLNSLEDCIRAAHAFDASLPAAGRATINDTRELEERARQVWRDLQIGRIQPWRGRQAVGTASVNEIKGLDECALRLLMILRAVHGAGSVEGQTFALDVNAMVRDKTLGSWAARKYQRAKRKLLAVGLIEEVRAHGYMVAAQYRLTSRKFSAQLAAKRTVTTADRVDRVLRKSISRKWPIRSTKRPTCANQRRTDQ